jgi:hypothetical protein
MKLNKVETAGGVAWKLEPEGESCSCRYCGKKLKHGDSGYFCPKDQALSCCNVKCIEKDNRWKHSRKYLVSDPKKDPHVHYMIQIVDWSKK